MGILSSQEAMNLARRRQMPQMRTARGRGQAFRAGHGVPFYDPQRKSYFLCIIFRMAQNFTGTMMRRSIVTATDFII